MFIESEYLLPKWIQAELFSESRANAINQCFFSVVFDDYSNYQKGTIPYFCEKIIHEYGEKSLLKWSTNLLGISREIRSIWHEYSARFLPSFLAHSELFCLEKSFHSEGLSFRCSSVFNRYRDDLVPAASKIAALSTSREIKTSMSPALQCLAIFVGVGIGVAITNCLMKNRLEQRPIEPIRQKGSLEILQDKLSENDPLKRKDFSQLISSDRNINIWLDKITGVHEKSICIWKGDREDLRIQLAKDTLSILDYAMNNKTFKDVFTSLVRESATDCGDRAVYFFNQLMQKKDLYETIEKFNKGEINLKDLLNKFKLYFPIHLIEKRAEISWSDKIARDQEVLNRYYSPELAFHFNNLLKEELEFHLWFLFRFQKDFNYPLAISQSNFALMGSESRSDFLAQTKELVEQACLDEEQFTMYLVECPEWCAFLSTEQDFQIGMRSLEEAREQGLSNLEDALFQGMNNEEYNRQLKQIYEEFNQCKRTLIIQSSRKYTSQRA